MPERFGWLRTRLNPDRHWRAALQEAVRHLPPSGATLRLLVLSDVAHTADQARLLRTLRPDIQLISGLVDPSARNSRAASLFTAGTAALQFAPDRWPLPANGCDAILAHNQQPQTGFLNEARRVLRPGGRLILLDALPADVTNPERYARQLEQAGFARVFGERLSGSGWVISRGEKVAPQHIIRRAGRPVPEATSQLLYGDSLRDLPVTSVFLLIRQTPVQPSWLLPAGTPIHWEALSIVDMESGTGEHITLAFSALPTAVAWMQPAVRTGKIQGVTRIARFAKSTAITWPFALLLNPAAAIIDFDSRHDHKNSSTTRYRIAAVWLTVDPQQAVTGDE